jgi:hypothetical protein
MAAPIGADDTIVVEEKTCALRNQMELWGFALPSEISVKLTVTYGQFGQAGTVQILNRGSIVDEFNSPQTDTLRTLDFFNDDMPYITSRSFRTMKDPARILDLKFTIVNSADGELLFDRGNISYWKLSADGKTSARIFGALECGRSEAGRTKGKLSWSAYFKHV